MITIDQNTCIGCGFCVSACPASFAFDPDQGKAKVVNSVAAACAPAAADACPVQAIKLI
jgi:ferredoxin